MAMAGSVNKVIIIGNLGQDPEVRSFPSGGKVCNFSVATSENWKDRNTGERREKTEWHRVSITSEPLVRVAEQYLRKGSKVYLEGQLETRKWQDQSGQDRYTTEVVLRPYRSELTMLDSRGEGGGAAAKGVDISAIKMAVARAVTWPIPTRVAIRRAVMEAPRPQLISMTKSHFKSYPSADVPCTGITPPRHFRARLYGTRGHRLLQHR